MQEAVFGADLSGNLDTILIHLNIQLGLRFEAKDCQENYLVLRLTREAVDKAGKSRKTFGWSCPYWRHGLWAPRRRGQGLGSSEVSTTGGESESLGPITLRREKAGETRLQARIRRIIS